MQRKLSEKVGKKYETYEPNRRSVLTTEEKREKQVLRGVPNTFCQLVKTQVRLCPLCPRMRTKITTPWHLKYAHGIEIKHTSKIWREDIKPLVQSNKKRTELLHLIDKICVLH